MGWMPELGRCSVCGLAPDPGDAGGGTVWYSAAGYGVTCADDSRPETHCSVRGVWVLLRGCFARAVARKWPRMTGRSNALRTCGGSPIELLERHLEDGFEERAERCGETGC